MYEKLLMKTALLAGKILMENGAEVYRTEDTLERIIKYGVGDERTDEYYTHVTLTGIFVRIEGFGTDFRRVGDRTYNLTKISEVNALSRAFTSGKISLPDMYKALKRVQEEKSPIKDWFKVLCSGVLSGSIVLIFDGNFWDVIPGGIAGAVAFYVYIKVIDYLPKILNLFNFYTFHFKKTQPHIQKQSLYHYPSNTPIQNSDIFSKYYSQISQNY